MILGCRGFRTVVRADVVKDQPVDVRPPVNSQRIRDILITITDRGVCTLQK